MRHRLKDTLKEIIQSTEHPIVFVSAGYERLQTLYLYQYKKETMLGGQPIPRGTYLLTDKKTILKLSRYKTIQKVSDEPITAFVLHYIEEGTGKSTMSDSADIVVTPRLTGCTVAAEINSETPTLLHVNRLKEANRQVRENVTIPVHVIDQEAINRDIEAKMQDISHFSIKKEEYTLTDRDEMFYAATFMGFKEVSGWSYLTQITQYDEGANTYSVHSGKQFTPTPPGLSQMSLLQHSSSPSPTSTASSESDEADKKSGCPIM